MSMLKDFLNNNGLNADVLASRSKAIETRSEADRNLNVKRAMVRAKKQKYSEANLNKPSALGRGIGAKSIHSALEGKPVSQVNRKKILRAVNSLLVSAKKEKVETKHLFGDVPSTVKKKEKKS